MIASSKVPIIPIGCWSAMFSNVLSIAEEAGNATSSHSTKLQRYASSRSLRGWSPELRTTKSVEDFLGAFQGKK